MKYVLTGGLIVDGKGNKPYEGAVYIEDGFITNIIETEGIEEGYEVIELNGKVISPGFIDIHTHSDIAYTSEYTPESKVYQGVTTEIVGNCGISSIPYEGDHMEDILDYFNSIIETNAEGGLKSGNIKEYISEMNNSCLPINIGVLIGHGTLRGAVMGFDDRDPTEDEMNRMCEVLERELRNGAFGLSLGLIYPPGSYSSIQELIRLAEIVAKYDGVIAVHMRNEGEKVFESVDEMIKVAEETGVKMNISHLKLIGKKQWGRSGEILDNIERAIESGSRISCDQYPYTATSTSLAALLPGWAQDGGLKMMLKRLEKNDDKLDQEIIREMESRGGPDRVIISGTEGGMPSIEGMSINRIAKLKRITPIEAVKLVLISSKGVVHAVYHSLDQNDMHQIMKRMYIAIGSDGYAFSYNPDYTTNNPHPRSFGTFPRFFEIVRDNKLMTLGKAVQKVTSIPANIMGINDRGVIELGKVADITVFDYLGIKDNSSFEDSVKKPSGIEYVFVNGEILVEKGIIVKNRRGKVITRP